MCAIDPLLVVECSVPQAMPCLYPVAGYCSLTWLFLSPSGDRAHAASSNMQFVRSVQGIVRQSKRSAKGGTLDGREEGGKRSCLKSRRPETAAEESPKGFTRRQVVAGGIGVGLVGLIAGGALAKWGVIEDTIASGRVAVNVTPTKLIVTDRARCSGCQRCEMMCSLRNDGRVC